MRRVAIAGPTRELVETSDGGCGSCIPCVTKSGAPCVLGHRRRVLSYASTPAPGVARGGRDLPSMHTPREVYQTTKTPAERELWREAEPLDFEPCRAGWCGRRELHPKHDRRSRR